MTIKIKNILVPLDGSPNSFRGLDVAIHMARQCQTTITGLYVAGITKPRTNDVITPLEKILLEHAQKNHEKIQIKGSTKRNFIF